MTTCSPGKSSQQWELQPSGHIASGGTCLDVYNFQGPDVEYYSCKAPGDSDANQVWILTSLGQLVSNTTAYAPESQVGVVTARAHGWRGRCLLDV